MAYLLDDDWDNDPRVSRAGTAAFGLYSRCGMWVARHLTDGHVPREIATAYGTTEWVAKLVAVGLWQQTEDGYQMPDYLDRNPSRDKVERRRKQYTERQERWRLRTSQVQTRDKRITNASGNASPSPLSKERRGRTPATPGAARAPTPPPNRHPPSTSTTPTNAPNATTTSASPPKQPPANAKPTPTKPTAAPPKPEPNSPPEASHPAGEHHEPLPTGRARAADYADRRNCTACLRSGTELEFRPVDGFGETWLCVDPVACRRAYERAEPAT